MRELPQLRACRAVPQPRRPILGIIVALLFACFTASAHAQVNGPGYVSQGGQPTLPSNAVPAAMDGDYPDPVSESDKRTEASIWPGGGPPNLNPQDQTALAKAAVADKDRLVRAFAVRRLADRALLAKIAVEDTVPLVRWTAVKRLRDQPLLTIVATRDPDSSVRVSAVQQLTDQAALAKVVIENQDSYVRCVAVEKLEDQALLARIAVEDRDRQVRLSAVRTLRDQAMLTRIAIDDRDLQIRSAAVCALGDQAMLARIAIEDADSNSRLLAAGKLNDMTLMARIAGEDMDARVRSCAMQRLSELVPPPQYEIRTTEREISVDLGNQVKLEMVLVPDGEFLMGSPESGPDATMPKVGHCCVAGFHLGKYPVTQEQWFAVMGYRCNNDNLHAPKSPVELASWKDFCLFLARLNDRTRGRLAFTFPTDVQWEYACRAGSTARFFFGDDSSRLRDYAWYHENNPNRDKRARPAVGQKLPNAWGLYDMLGNVDELCLKSPVGSVLPVVEMFRRQEAGLPPMPGMVKTTNAGWVFADPDVFASGDEQERVRKSKLGLEGGRLGPDWESKTVVCGAGCERSALCHGCANRACWPSVEAAENVTIRTKDLSTGYVFDRPGHRGVKYTYYPVGFRVMCRLVGGRP
jgi:formylglycine-generating enzyme required for sulfatase activity